MPGISLSMISVCSLKVSFSIPFVTVTTFCPSGINGANSFAVLLVKEEATEKTIRSRPVAASSASCVKTIFSGN